MRKEGETQRYRDLGEIEKYRGSREETVRYRDLWGRLGDIQTQVIDSET